MTLHEAVGGRLQSLEQRYTSRRRELVDLLEAAARPLSIPDILDQRRDLAQSSVYRNLAVLEQAGAVRRVLGVDEFARYELAEELTSHHHHLVCRGCGDVSDFASSSRFERSLEKAIDDIAAATGFSPDGHRLDLMGRCSKCVTAQ